MKQFQINENKKLVPLKRFGQNYLRDKNILCKIVDEINPCYNDNIIEIGPGFGALTEFLINKVKFLTAIEIDNGVCEKLKFKFPSLNLINEDILNIDLMGFFTDKKLRIVGNIPFNITSPIIFKLIKDRKIVEDAVFMVQYEVAKRMTARIATKDYGILSILLKAFGKVQLCFKVSPNVFYPKPKVDSAIVHIFFKENNSIQDEKVFINVVKSSFSARRKILKNSLSSSIFANINYDDCPINLSLRAEQLSIDDFINLSNFINKKLKTNF